MIDFSFFVFLGVNMERDNRRRLNADEENVVEDVASGKGIARQIIDLELFRLRERFPFVGGIVWRLTHLRASNF